MILSEEDMKLFESVKEQLLRDYEENTALNVSDLVESLMDREDVPIHHPIHHFIMAEGKEITDRYNVALGGNIPLTTTMLFGNQMDNMVREQAAEMFGKLAIKAGIRRDQISSAVITGNTTMLHLLAGLSVRSIGRAPFTPDSYFGEWGEFALPGWPSLKCYLPSWQSATRSPSSCSMIKRQAEF